MFDALNVTIIFRLSDVDTFAVDRFLQVFRTSNICFNFDNENFIATILQWGGEKMETLISLEAMNTASDSQKRFNAQNVYI